MALRFVPSCLAWQVHAQIMELKSADPSSFQCSLHCVLDAGRGHSVGEKVPTTCWIWPASSSTSLQCSMRSLPRFPEHSDLFSCFVSCSAAFSAEMMLLSCAGSLKDFVVPLVHPQPHKDRWSSSVVPGRTE